MIGADARQREDLLHMSPEALAHAANAGIVKRAVRELASGPSPILELDRECTLHAAFDDGTSCRWPRGVPIQSAHCSCGASGVCRHLVIAALAYRASTLAPAAAAAVAHAADEHIERVVPAQLREAATRLRDAGISVEIRRISSGEPCETARLPAATVRFWGGAALEAARCDCLRAAACEHVALGVWAFRAADEVDTDAPQLTVRLGAPGTRTALDRAPFEALVAALLRHGVAQGTAALAQALSAARHAAAPAAWLALLVAEIEEWSAAYERRSALYDATDGADLVSELALRLAGGNRPGAAAALLGTDQAGETALDRVRLMCLGARTRRDGEARQSTLVMADLDTGTRLVLNHGWSVPEARRADEARLRAAERIATGVALEALAQGQLLAHGAARRPDGSLRLSRARAAHNSVLPQNADWSALGAPLRFDSVAMLAAERRAQPNAALQPRHAARSFAIFTPASVDEARYDANAQAVFALLRDASGNAVLVRRSHERHTPHALDAMAAALTGGLGPLRHVAGRLYWERGLPCLEPWAFACQGALHVPDFAASSSGALATLPLGLLPHVEGEAAEELLAAIRRQAGTLLHHGLAQLPASWCPESAQLARRLEAAGLRTLGKHLASFVPMVAAAQVASDAAPLADTLLLLLALAQLHLDAMAMPDEPTAGN